MSVFLCTQRSNDNSLSLDNKVQRDLFEHEARAWEFFVGPRDLIDESNDSANEKGLIIRNRLSLDNFLLVNLCSVRWVRVQDVENVIVLADELIDNFDCLIMRERNILFNPVRHLLSELALVDEVFS